MKALVFCIAAMALTPSAWAMTETKSDTATAPDDKDSSRLICKREKVIGSRLSSKKVCATPAEWAQMRADQRQTTERIQANRPREGN